MERVKICPVCEEEFSAQYRNKKYCSEACKQKMYRLRLLNKDKKHPFHGIESGEERNKSTIEFSIQQVTKFAIEIAKSWAAKIISFFNEDCYHYYDLKLIHSQVNTLREFLTKKYFPSSGVLFSFFNFVNRLFNNLNDHKKEMDNNGWIYFPIKSKEFKPCKKVLDLKY